MELAILKHFANIYKRLNISHKIVNYVEDFKGVFKNYSSWRWGV